MYDTEIAEANKLVEDSKRDSAIAYGKKLEAEEELKRQKSRYSSLSTLRVADQKEFDSILQRYMENEAVRNRTLIDILINFYSYSKLPYFVVA